MFQKCRILIALKYLKINTKEADKKDKNWSVKVYNIRECLIPGLGRKNK